MPMELAIVLAIVQALTEFLPVSSSGHLVLFQQYLGPVFNAPPTPLAFDILVHFATFLATTVYLRSELWQMTKLVFIRSAAGTEMRRLVFLLGLGSIPAAIVGLGFHDAVESAFSSLFVVGIGFLVTSSLLETAHRRMKKKPTSETPKSSSEKTLQLLSWKIPSVKQVMIIGCTQAIAICPGISRSGSTVTAALLCGVSRESSVKFSLLLSLPTILGATLLSVRDLAELPSEDFLSYSVAFFVTFIVALFSLSLLMKVVTGDKLRWFSIYTAILGACVLSTFYV